MNKKSKIAVAHSVAGLGKPGEYSRAQSDLVTLVRGGPQCLVATRRSLYLMALAPAWAGAAVWFLSNWPWRMAAGQLSHSA